MSKDDVCLAVSRVKACWDTNAKIAFVSEGVVDFLDEEWLKTIDCHTINGPWATLNYQTDIYSFVIERLPRYRKELSIILNDIHGVNYGTKYWGFILDSWLLHFLTVIYDRVAKLENANKHLDNVYIRSLRMSEICFDTTKDFNIHCREEVFNQFLCAEIASVIGIKVDKAEFISDQYDFDKKGSNKKVSVSIYKKYVVALSKLIIRPLFSVWIKIRSPVLIVDGYFSKKDAVRIMLRSFGGIVIILPELFFQRVPTVEKNNKLRVGLNVNDNDKYDKVANKLFSSCFPKSFLENYSVLNESMSGFSGLTVIGSATGFYFNDQYKILAGKVINAGGKVIGFQHGGGYGILKNKLTEYFERLSVDKYYGWKTNGYLGYILPTPKLRLLRAHKNKRENNQSKQRTNILFVSTNNDRYVFSQHPDSSDHYLKMVSDQQMFYSQLDSNVKKNFLLRPYPVDHGWHYKERWLERFGDEIKFDTCSRIDDSLVVCRIYITDHISTTWLQALYIGTPVMFYFNVDRYGVRDDVMGLFEELKSVGILHDTPGDAAFFLNSIIHDLEGWWASAKTQSVVKDFKNCFFHSSESFVKDWTDELLFLNKKQINGE